MKKTIAILLLIMVLLPGCGKTDFSSSSRDDSLINSDSTSVQFESSEENVTNESDGQKWPDVIPDYIPELKDIVIEGYYPLVKDASEYTVNFSVYAEDEKVLLDYIAELTAAGCVQEYKTDNNFGFDYFGSADQYDVFLNVVYEGASKVGITIKK